MTLLRVVGARPPVVARAARGGPGAGGEGVGGGLGDALAAVALVGAGLDDQAPLRGVRGFAEGSGQWVPSGLPGG